VPAHDERDYAFAEKYKLPITEVVVPYVVNDGINAPRDDVETLHRDVIDAIIVNEKGEYLLEVEADNVHFVGGGVDPEDTSDEDAVRREVTEEVGYMDFASIRPVSSTIKTFAYRIPKQKNQSVSGRFYEVVLATDNQVKSEIEEGRHSIKWVRKEDVADLITWPGHALAWQQYLDEKTLYHGEGLLINSGKFDGKSTSDAREEIVAWLEKEGTGRSKVTYKMRDWLISRQRYWGAPIPIIYCPDHGAARK